MKKFLVILTALFVSLIAANVSAAPTCVMMKFTNDTRFKNIDTAELLSDLVLEKLLASGKFNFVETRPLDSDIEIKLYNEKLRDVTNVENAVKTKSNFNSLFEGSSFDTKYAQSIATAEVGQLVAPEIVSEIGKEHGAEYLIQGTIINLGNGNLKTKRQTEQGFVIDTTTSVIAVVADVRLIKVSNGEVIWRKSSRGEKTTGKSSMLFITLGSSKLTSEMYNEVVEKCANKIVKDMIKDLNANKIFVK